MSMVNSQQQAAFYPESEPSRQQPAASSNLSLPAVRSQQQTAFYPELESGRGQPAVNIQRLPLQPAVNSQQQAALSLEPKPRAATSSGFLCSRPSTVSSKQPYPLSRNPEQPAATAVRIQRLADSSKQPSTRSRNPAASIQHPAVNSKQPPSFFLPRPKRL